MNKLIKVSISFLIIFNYFIVNGYGLNYEYLKTKQDREQVKKELQKFKNPVQLIVFSSKNPDCRYCELTKQIVAEIISLTDKVKAEYYDYDKDKEMVKKYNIDKVPAIIVMNNKNKNILFFGVPGGYEFSSLLETMKYISLGNSNLSKKSIDKLNKINKKITIQVFVTPTCPYCPMAVVMAHRIAMVNPKIQAEMIEAQEFMDLSTKNNVSAVPKIVIVNEKGKKVEFTGSYPEDQFVEKVLSVK